jgi:hypothetical protein
VAKTTNGEFCHMPPDTSGRWSNHRMMAATFSILTGAKDLVPLVVSFQENELKK